MEDLQKLYFKHLNDKLTDADKLNLLLTRFPQVSVTKTSGEYVELVHGSTFAYDYPYTLRTGLLLCYRKDLQSVIETILKSYEYTWREF